MKYVTPEVELMAVASADVITDSTVFNTPEDEF